MSSSSSSTKLCFNSNCKELLERPRKGWRRRTGEFADLCDRCASAYEEGKFCETFHVNASGWRCCESCGKQIHCGCIVSFHMFVLLDAGGIECITCARKSFILTPNPAWPPPSLILPLQPERIKDLSVKSWSPIAGSGPVPWRQAPSLFNYSLSQCEVQTKMPFEVDISGDIDRLVASERLSTSSLEKWKKDDSFERLSNGGSKIGASDVPENGNIGNCGEKLNISVNISYPSPFPKNGPSATPFSLAVTSASKIETNDPVKVFSTHAPRQIPPFPIVKRVNGHNGVDSSDEAQMCNGRPRGDGRGRTQLLPRYWPRISDQELQQLSGDCNSVITPLFEKMLSASDAGRIGRLVLPKKCAEAYFPPISQPEGLPLKVQDIKGKEWVFQFRFWPNNNSRMYVLEGITPCMQSMQLQAGDIVTFSRLEPEGKLVMGCRKVTHAPSFDQASEVVNTSNGVCPHGDVTIRNAKSRIEVSVPRPSKGSSVLHSFSSINRANLHEPVSSWCDVDKSGYIAKEVLEAKPSSRGKRKNDTLGFKSKWLRIDNADMIELKVTLEQVQGLLRPPPNHVPTVVVIEGFEFEEYEQDAPIIGRPTIFAANNLDVQMQWAQCDNCFKWRKVPADVVFPSKWTCSENSWDPKRSLCSIPEELTYEQLTDLLPTCKRATSMKMKATKEDPSIVDALEGLDTLANLAIQEEGELSSASQATTKHPRHRPGCTCIVCIQPPSGKGPKHKHTCKCNVCETVKRRFRTLMSRREKKMSDKEAETTCQNLLQVSEQLPDDDIHLYCHEGIDSRNKKMLGNEGFEDDPSNGRSSTLPFKCQIDLNIQPEREEELSPGLECRSMMSVSSAATSRYLRQQRLPSSVSSLNVLDRQAQLNETGGGDFREGVAISGSHQNTDQQMIVSLTTPSV